ncbi:MAG: hypothetical protein IKU33_05375 [Bacteroidales bacterium]|nr:hypothetical protein [Bacteroidales bacterium]
MSSVGSGIKSVFNAIDHAQKEQARINEMARKAEMKETQRQQRMAADSDLVNDVIELGNDVTYLKSEMQTLRQEIDNLRTQISILSTEDMSGFASSASQPYTAGPLNYFPM